MELLILRHGTAEERRPGLADEDRKLTPSGRRDTRAIAKLALKAREIPQLILTSPLQRAIETAGIAAGIMGCGRVKETTALLPDALPERIWEELTKLPGIEVAMLVGHEPHMGLLIQFLLEAHFRLRFRKAGLVKIIAGGRSGSPRGQLEWMLAPRLIRRG